MKELFLKVFYNCKLYERHFKSNTNYRAEVSEDDGEYADGEYAARRAGIA